MIARGFKPVAWVAAVAAPALVCYGLSLKVASEKAALDQVEASILAARQDIRSLQTELDTRGRLTQLEQWNAEVLALSAPTAGQFVRGDVSLARFDTRGGQFAPHADVQLATAEVPRAANPAETAPRQASLERATPAPAPASPVAPVRQASLAPDRAIQTPRSPEMAAPQVRRASVSTTESVRAPARAVAAPSARPARLEAARLPARATARRSADVPAARSRALVSADTQAALGRQARSERQRGPKRD